MYHHYYKMNRDTLMNKYTLIFMKRNTPCRQNIDSLIFEAETISLEAMVNGELYADLLPYFKWNMDTTRKQTLFLKDLRKDLVNELKLRKEQFDRVQAKIDAMQAIAVEQPESVKYMQLEELDSVHSALLSYTPMVWDGSEWKEALAIQYASEEHSYVHTGVDGIPDGKYVVVSAVATLRVTALKRNYAMSRWKIDTRPWGTDFTAVVHFKTEEHNWAWNEIGVHAHLKANGYECHIQKSSISGSIEDLEAELEATSTAILIARNLANRFNQEAEDLE